MHGMPPSTRAWGAQLFQNRKDGVHRDGLPRPLLKWAWVIGEWGCGEPVTHPPRPRGIFFAPAGSPIQGEGRGPIALPRSFPPPGPEFKSHRRHRFH